jgi:hypothetical protein
MQFLETPMKLATFLAAAALSVPLAGHAGVIYEWRALGGGTPEDISLRLEFSQQAVDSGAFSFQLPYLDAATSYPDSGLVSLHYSFPGSSQPMQYRPQEERFRGGLGMLDMALRFEPGGYLSGWIRANDQNSDFSIGSSGTVFTFLRADSDQGMPGAGCGWTTGVACFGATGYLQALSQGVRREVPEPRTLGLLGLGAFGLFAARRRAS